MTGHQERRPGFIRAWPLFSILTVLISGVNFRCGPGDTPVGIEVALPPVDGVVAGAIPGASGSGLSAPTISTFVPEVGTTDGGNVIRVTGSGFNLSTQVTFDSVPATSVLFISATELDVAVPPNGTTKDAEVQVRNGTLAAVATNRYSYVRPLLTFTAPVSIGMQITSGGRMAIGNFTPAGSVPDTFPDMAYIERGGTDVGVAIGDGIGGFTFGRFPLLDNVATPVAEGVQLTEITVGRVNGVDALFLTDQTGAPNAEVLVIYRTAADLDTIQRNNVSAGTSPIDLVYDNLNTQVFVLKQVGILEVSAVNNVGALTGTGSVTGGAGVTPSALALGTRNGVSTVLSADTGSTNARFIDVNNPTGATQVMVNIPADRAEAVSGTNGFFVLANDTGGLVRVVPQDSSVSTAPDTLDAGQSPIRGLAIGDVNGDGRDDVVVTTHNNGDPNSGNIRAFLNGGIQNSRLRFSAASSINQALLTDPRDVQIVSLGGVGDPVDILVLTSSGNNLTILQGM